MNRTRPRVLIVEDDPFAAEMVAWLFEHWGCSSTIAATVAQAIEKLDVPADLVLLDLMLPDGDGTRVLAAVRALDPPRKVAVWTAIAALEPARLEPYSPDWILHKPSSIEALEVIAGRLKADFAATHPPAPHPPRKGKG